MKRTLSIALVSALALFGSCGDDDDTETGSASAPTETTAGDEGEQAVGDGDFCAAYQEQLAGDPTPEQMRELAEVAPADAREALETLAAGFEGNPEFFTTPEFAEAFSALAATAVEDCADEVIDVTAVDYAFEGMPSDVATGTLGVTLTNDGNEYHEMIVFRKDEGVTSSFEEIFAMDQDEAEGLLSDVGGTFVAPGKSAGGLFDVSEAGEYAAVCFLRVGTTSPDAESNGPPHFTQGMLTTFTVS